MERQAIPNRIEINGAGLVRDHRAVLQDISLVLTEPRIALIGRNGSGKSTLIRLMAGLIAPDSGTVIVNGADVVRDRAKALDQVGILFQNPDHQIIFPTVIEEIAFGLRQQGDANPQETARTCLERFDRAGWANRPVSELSQGQRHLVCLMSVLAMRPNVILLDEPMAGLDLPTMTALQDMLGRLPQTIVHATHDLSLVEGYDRVIWLERGRVIGDGPPEEVLGRFVDEMTGGADAFADVPA